ncbi:hypothetical protein ACS15_2302 [Ralstonia insidiosa]|uniref:Uncharacterized protein n=1 Tax=Ralstonia insidiosa TaxID=190721 RepID=A0AAC9BDP2_9RALS|nr:hypothetical protein ACS15_2302 [Ralstonia insidiosa]
MARPAHSAKHHRHPGAPKQHTHAQQRPAIKSGHYALGGQLFLCNCHHIRLAYSLYA